MKRPILPIASLFLLLGPAAPAETPPDKSRYNLFHPTPRDAMREMSTDRPDKTESPYTVDAGHFQVEADIVSYSYDRYNSDHANVRVESFAVAPMNLKAGLLPNVDFQCVIETYVTQRTRDFAAGTEEHRSGFGDIINRLKVNLWGNDRGRTALAVMPFVKWPTNQDDLGNDAIEGGLIIPLGVELPAGWGMGLMTELDFNRDEFDSGHHVEFVNSITFSHDIVGTLGGYVEFFSAVSDENSSDWTGTVDVGLTWGMTDDIQLDTGVNVGVTRAADDINPFLGISVRH